MIGAINPNLAMQRPLQPQVIEGAASTAGRVSAVVLSIIAALASFIFLPIEGALMVSAGLAGLMSMICCYPSRSGTDGTERRWYTPFVNAIPVFFRPSGPSIVPAYVPHHVPSGPNAVVHGQPVLNAGPRPAIGGGHRAPFNGVQVLPPYQGQPQAHPAAFGGAPGGPAIGPNVGHRAPVGQRL